MSPTLRTATAADASRIADILIETRAAFMHYAPSVHSESDVRNWVRSHLVPAGGVLVAEFQGSVVGAVATSRDASTSWITQMAVDPGLVGRGIGSCLLAHVLNALPRPIRLLTFQQNVGARRFYERHGYVAVAFTDGQDNEEQCRVGSNLH